MVRLSSSAPAIAGDLRLRLDRDSLCPVCRDPLDPLSVRCSPDRYGLISKKTMAATESAASSNSPTSISSLLSMGIARFAVRLGGSERLRQASSFAVILGALPEARAGDARRSMRARDFAVGSLGDMRDFAGAIAQARGLHDNVDRADDHFTDGF